MVSQHPQSGEPPQPAPSGSQEKSKKSKWVTPEVTELPRLTDLTLQSGIPGIGNPGSGSTVF